MERREKLEQLRALDAGMRIDVALVDTVPLGVDTAADLDRARRLARAFSRVPIMSNKHIAFQGLPGAYSDMACRAAFADREPLPCETFEDAFAAVEHGQAALGMIPVENSIAGRVADIHHLLPDSGLHIVAEYFHRVQHQLLGLPGTKIADLRTVHSHVHALAQCRKMIRELDLAPMVEADTAARRRRSPIAATPARQRSPRRWRRRFMAWRFSRRISRTPSTTPPVFW